MKQTKVHNLIISNPHGTKIKKLRNIIVDYDASVRSSIGYGEEQQVSEVLRRSFE